MTGTPELWARFTHDPRDPGHASLRAADVDRDVVHQVLAEAYADGRLDREELDARTTEVAGARTLGDLVPPLEGLVPVAAFPAIRPGGAVPDAGIEQQADQKWRDERRSAVGGFVTASLICWVIWATVMFGGFPWPLFVMLGTGLNALNTHSQRASIVARERKRLERKQRKELEAPKPEPRDPEEDGA